MIFLEKWTRVFFFASLFFVISSSAVSADFRYDWRDKETGDTASPNFATSAACENARQGALQSGDTAGLCYEASTASGECNQQYDGCTTPNGKAGYCWPDDDSSDGYACLPSDNVGSGGSVGGGGCIVASNNTSGTCQAVGAACAGVVGTPKAGSSCTAEQVCCSTVTTGGGGGGGGSGVGSGSTEGLQCRQYFCWPSQSGLSSSPISSILVRVMNWLLIVLGSIAVIAFVISGLQYLLASGNEEWIEMAKRNMRYSIVGVLVALMGLVIIFAVDRALFAGSPFF